MPHCHPTRGQSNDLHQVAMRHDERRMQRSVLSTAGELRAGADLCVSTTAAYGLHLPADQRTDMWQSDMPSQEPSKRSRPARCGNAGSTRGEAVTRYCEDCRWFKYENTCDAPQNRVAMLGRYGLVLRDSCGNKLYSYRWLTASFQRSINWPWDFLIQRACGKRGRWFQACDALSAGECDV